jgi:hypothetical protein
MICGPKVKFLPNLEFWWESEITQIFINKQKFPEMWQFFLQN